MNTAQLRKAGLWLALAIFLLDRGTKLLMTHVLELQYYQVYELLPFFDLRWTQNFGVSMGMFTATRSPATQRRAIRT